MNNKRYKNLLAALVLILATAAVYQAGLEGTFVFDDISNIVKNKSLVLEDFSLDSLLRASYSSGSGPLQRPLSMLSFALNLEACGLSPSCFKLVNIIIHILCGLVLFLLMRRLMVRYRSLYEPALDNRTLWMIAYGIALLWLLHPINLTSVLYVVQRMNSLAALLTLVGMLFYLTGRDRLLENRQGWHWILAGYGMTVPAMLAKENGALLPLFLLLIEIFFYKFQTDTQKNRNCLLVLSLSTVFIPAIAMLLFLIARPEWLIAKYEFRNFTLHERVLTQARAVWYYISLVLVPSNQRLSLYHDAFVVSQGLLVPITTLLSVAGLIATTLVLFLKRNRVPLLSFGFFFFIAGHALESTIFPLEMIFEHRNYLPGIGLLIPLVYYLVSDGFAQKTTRLRRFGLVVIVILFGSVTFMRAQQWNNPLLLAEMEVRANPDSPRVNYSVGAIYATIYDKVPEEYEQEFYTKAISYFSQVNDLDPNNLSGIASKIIIAAKHKNMQKVGSFNILVDQFRTKKITATDVDVVRKLIRCVNDGACEPDAISIRRLASAIDQNSNMTGKSAAIIYGLLSAYFWNQLDEAEIAYKYSLNAIQSYPGNNLLKLNHAKLLIAMNRPNEAREIVEYVKEDDYMNILAQTIQELEAKLGQQSTSRD